MSFSASTTNYLPRITVYLGGVPGTGSGILSTNWRWCQ